MPTSLRSRHKSQQSTNNDNIDDNSMNNKIDKPQLIDKAKTVLNNISSEPFSPLDNDDDDDIDETTTTKQNNNDSNNIQHNITAPSSTPVKQSKLRSAWTRIWTSAVMFFGIFLPALYIGMFTYHSLYIQYT